MSGANVTRQTDGSPGNYLLSMLDVQQSRLWVDVWMLLSCLCVCVCNVMKCIVMKCIVLYCIVMYCNVCMYVCMFVRLIVCLFVKWNQLET